MKIALNYFIPADPAELDFEGTDALYEGIDFLEPVNEDHLEQVKGVKIGLIATDRNYLDFFYWGQFNKF